MGLAGIQERALLDTGLRRHDGQAMDTGLHRHDGQAMDTGLHRYDGQGWMPVYTGMTDRGGCRSAPV